MKNLEARVALVSVITVTALVALLALLPLGAFVVGGYGGGCW